jgi:hypothetical protein
MPCICPACVEHGEFLGLAQKGPTRAAIRKAYKTEAKRWHPDRFEKNPAQRHDAEEHFKLIQVAYQALSEHCEKPAVLAVEEFPAEAPPEAPPDATPTPSIFFGTMAGCFTAPNFSAAANRVILATRMEPSEKPLAFVDLSHGVRREGVPSQYVLLTSYRMVVRNALNIVAFLWYTDLGELSFIDRLTHGKSRLWRRMVEMLGMEPRYSLLIGRHDGSLFHAIEGEADDRVKRVIYNFLRQIQSQQHA